MSQEVLVVARTRMTSGACIGGIVRRDGRSVRLLDSEGYHFPTDVDLEVGRVYNMTLSKCKGLAAPHLEDVRVMAHGDGQAVNDLADEIKKHATPAVGGPEFLFDGRLVARETGKRFLDPGSPTNYSTQFWIPSCDLELDVNEWNGKIKHEYYSEDFRVKYVGFADPPEVIEAGQLVRVSLSKPFSIPGTPHACWLQLSHAY